MRRKLIYLAGPYSHKNDQVREGREELHAKAALQLKAAGYAVYCPIAETVTLAKYGKLTNTDWAYWREHDLPLLDACEELVILTIPGWRESIGVRGEVKRALQTDKPISLYDMDIEVIFPGINILHELGVKTESELND